MKPKYWKKYYRKHKNLVLARNKICRRKKIDALVARFKSAPCMDCRRSFPSCAMDFDHRPSEQKSFILAGSNIVKRRLDLVIAEIAKCDLVCANCHRIRTQLRRAETLL